MKQEVDQLKIGCFTRTFFQYAFQWKIVFGWENYFKTAPLKWVYIYWEKSAFSLHSKCSFAASF